MKNPLASKTNWFGLAMLFLGLIVDNPEFKGYLVNIVPPQILPKIISTCGIIVMVLRTYYTNQAVGFSAKTEKIDHTESGA